IVNALLFPYLNNAVRMLENGTASRDDIDAAMQGGCNFPMGPPALLDLVGLDTSVAILDALYEEFRDPNYAPVPLLRRIVSAGHLGRSAGRGFSDCTRRAGAAGGCHGVARRRRRRPPAGARRPGWPRHTGVDAPPARPDLPRPCGPVLCWAGRRPR